jgi:hypothetical protein
LCDWDAQQGRHVTPAIFQATGSESPADRFNHAKTPVPGVTVEPAGGVGDDAYDIYFNR